VNLRGGRKKNGRSGETFVAVRPGSYGAFVAGLAGLTFMASSAADAGAGGSSHEAMHRMMDAMHGEGTSDRLHALDGGEQMIDKCARMHDAMGGGTMRSGMRGDR
jgi:hypothetical protein